MKKTASVGSSTAALMAIPTGFPIGGLYVIDTITGANLGRRADGQMPKRFKDEAAAERFIESVGSKPWPEALFAQAVISLVVEKYDAVSRDDDWRVCHVLQTPAGEMTVWPTEDWIACKFADPALATMVVRSGSLNPFSGKWNWHGTEETRQDTVYAFAEALADLYKSQPRTSRVQPMVIDPAQAALF